MDKIKAIELLKQFLTEIPHLKKLQHDSKEFELWFDKVKQIISNALGKDDLVTFISTDLPIPVIDFLTPPTVIQNYYLKRLAKYGVNIEKIIQKYEMLGIEEKPTAKAEPPNAPENYKEKESKELELVLEGTPDMILECIRSTVEALNSQGYKYSFRRTSDAPDYARWDKTYFATCAIFQGDEGQIGTIKLQFLPKDRTLLKSLEPEDWGSPFGHFLNCLFAEFQALGFVELVGEKSATTAEIPPKAFIAHGGKSEARDKLHRFLTALGVTTFIIEEEPKEGRSVNEQVEYYLERADCAIILGTADDRELKDGKLYPRRNVHIEIGRFQEKFPNRIIYLLEEGASFPSNISEKLYTRFTQANMEEAFITVARELKAFKMIQVVKP